jgi:hypothetical protein
MGAAALPDPLNLDVIAHDPVPPRWTRTPTQCSGPSLACRRADARLAPGDAAGAREALKQPLLHRDREAPEHGAPEPRAVLAVRGFAVRPV